MHSINEGDRSFFRGSTLLRADYEQGRSRLAKLHVAVGYHQVDAPASRVFTPKIVQKLGPAKEQKLNYLKLELPET